MRNVKKLSAILALSVAFVSPNAFAAAEVNDIRDPIKDGAIAYRSLQPGTSERKLVDDFNSRPDKNERIEQFLSRTAEANPRGAAWAMCTGGVWGFKNTPATSEEVEHMMLAMRKVATHYASVKDTHGNRRMGLQDWFHGVANEEAGKKHLEMLDNQIEALTRLSEQHRERISGLEARLAQEKAERQTDVVNLRALLGQEKEERKSDVLRITREKNESETRFLDRLERQRVSLQAEREAGEAKLRAERQESEAALTATLRAEQAASEARLREEARAEAAKLREEARVEAEKKQAWMEHLMGLINKRADEKQAETIALIKHEIAAQAAEQAARAAEQAARDAMAEEKRQMEHQEYLIRAGLIKEESDGFQNILAQHSKSIVKKATERAERADKEAKEAKAVAEKARLGEIHARGGLAQLTPDRAGVITREVAGAIAEAERATATLAGTLRPAADEAVHRVGGDMTADEPRAVTPTPRSDSSSAEMIPIPEFVADHS